MSEQIYEKKTRDGHIKIFLLQEGKSGERKVRIYTKGQIELKTEEVADLQCKLNKITGLI